MSIQEATVKGLLINGVKDWIREKCGQTELEAFYDKFPDEMKEKFVKGLIMPISQLPASYYVKSYEAANALWGAKEPGIFQRIAAYVAFKDLSSIMKLFMKVGTPSLTASRFPNAWKHYFNQGTFTIVESSSNQLSAALEHADAYGIAGCEGTLGWTRKALEHAGARQLKADHYACRFKGQGNKCLFRYTWK